MNISDVSMDLSPYGSGGSHGVQKYPVGTPMLTVWEPREYMNILVGRLHGMSKNRGIYVGIFVRVP